MTSNRRRLARASTVAVSGVAALLVASAPALSAGTVSGTVASGTTRLILRTGASSMTPSVGGLPNGTTVTIACYVAGEMIKGRVRTTDRWDRLVGGHYISDAYVKRSRSVSACPPPPAPPAPNPIAPGSPTMPVIVPPTGAVAIGTWVTPIPGRGTSSFRSISRPTHDGIDIMAGRGTPIRATASGTVIRVVCNTSGPSCDVDGSPTTAGCGWYAEIRHAGNIITRYCHLLYRPSVEVGDAVKVGATIGYVGTSGHSSGTHLHFEVHYGGPSATRLNAIDPVAFMATAGAPVA